MSLSAGDFSAALSQLEASTARHERPWRVHGASLDAHPYAECVWDECALHYRAHIVYNQSYQVPQLYVSIVNIGTAIAIASDEQKQ